MFKYFIVAAFFTSVWAQNNFEPCTVEGQQICRVGGYQICAHHDFTGLTFGPVLSCGGGTTCFPSADGGIVCRPVSDLLQCPFGSSRCFNNTSVQQCTSFPRGTVWGNPVPCATGQTCQNGQCFNKPPPLPKCTIGNMECATATTFRTCVPSDNSNAKFITRSCAPGTECKPSGTFITCSVVV